MSQGTDARPDALTMARRCAAYVSKVASQMSNVDTALQARALGEDKLAAAAARVGASLALVSLAQDVRRLAECVEMFVDTEGNHE